jgi:hypothetical protein
MSGRNDGIQGTNVQITATALAVGHQARATAVWSERPQLDAAVAQLTTAISQLRLSPEHRAVVDAEVSRLHDELAQPQPDSARAESSLQALGKHLKNAGIALAAAVELIEPIKAIAAALKLPIAVLGWF